MRKYKVVVADSVKNAIRKNFDYIVTAYDNEPAALAHTIDIYKKMKSLEIFPKSHSIYEGRSDREYRIVRVRKYQIFYRIDDASDTVYVEKIYHSHQSVEL